MNITINYQTNSESLALNWLTPAQTAGKTLPYLFTQCEPAYCRSVAPLQDTPAVKVTYTAKVTVPRFFEVFMSANSTGMSMTPLGDMKIFTFEN